MSQHVTTGVPGIVESIAETMVSCRFQRTIPSCEAFGYPPQSHMISYIVSAGTCRVHGQHSRGV